MIKMIYYEIIENKEFDFVFRFSEKDTRMITYW
jgi:hypothetical protein